MGCPSADGFGGGLECLLLGVTHDGPQDRFGGECADQNHEAAQCEARAAAPKVTQVDPTESELGLYRVTVFTDQTGEADYSPVDPNPIAFATMSASSVRSRTLRFMARTARH